MASMPRLTEVGLQAIKELLIREFQQAGCSFEFTFKGLETMEARLAEISEENPVLAEWLMDSAAHLEKWAVQLSAGVSFPKGVPVDEDRAFISLRLVQNYFLLTIFQIYKAIKVQLEVDEMEMDPGEGFASLRLESPPPVMEKLDTTLPYPFDQPGCPGYTEPPPEIPPSVG